MARVTEGLIFNKSQEAVYKSRERLMKNQETAVTGKVVNRPSDNPVSAMRAMGLSAQMKRDEQVSTNMEIVSGMLSVADTTLGDLTEVLTRAKELSIQMSSSTNSGPESRLAVANEVEQLYMRAVQLGNTRFGDRYIFGGYQTDRAPFDNQGNYYGDNGSLELEIDKGQVTAIMVPGTYAFMGIKEMPAEAQSIRDNPARDGEASITNTVRAPAMAELGPDGKPLLRDKETRMAEQKEKDANSLEMGVEAGPKGINVFRALKGLADGLKFGIMDDVNKAIDEMDDAFNQILQTRTLIGAKQNTFKAGLESLDASKVNNSDQKSKVMDADMLSTFTELSRNEQALNATMEASKKLVTPSLIDFLK